MTQPLARPAQPHGATPVPAQRQPSPPASPQPPHPPRVPVVPPSPPRGTAWAEGTRRLRAAATTEPGRLRVIGAVLVLLVLLSGAVTAWQFSDRTSAADSVLEHSQPLSADAASIYRSLADADTAASSGFLRGGDEPRSMRQRYERDIKKASTLLTSAAANSGGSRSAQRQIVKLNRGLPRYTGLVDAARANNRQGLPLGGAYLRYANEQMRDELLPAAELLYTAQSARLGSDYEDAKAWPWFALAAAVVTIGALGWAQRRDYRRTNRVFNPGLLGATAASLVALVWLAAAQGLAVSALGESDEKGARSLHVLNEAWTGALQARGDENMTLVARGAGSQYEKGYRKQMREVAGAGRGVGEGGGEDGAEDEGASRAGPGGFLGRAAALADDRAGRQPVDEAAQSVERWRERHAKARALDDDGDYDDAVRMVIGAEGSTDETFEAVDGSLSRATEHEQSEFEAKAADGRGALGSVAVPAVVLGLIGAVAAVLGVGRRLSEYR